MVVATPGRLHDLIERDACRLGRVRITVLDEVDQMCDRGFLPKVADVLDQVHPGGQRMLFSATPDRDVDQLVRRHLHDPVVHSVDPSAGTVAATEHHVLVVHGPDRYAVTTKIAARDDRYRLAACLAAGPGGIVLESDTVTARLIVQAARRPGLSLVHQELLDFAGDEFYLITEPALTGRPFGDALLSYTTSSVVGMMRGDTPLLNPPPETPIAPDDLLVVISRDDDTAWLDDCAKLVEEAAMASGPPTPARAERVLLLGWNRRAPLIVDQLRRRARPGSAVDVVADRGEATARQVDEADANSGTDLSLILHHGDVTRPETLRRLDVYSYDSVIVLGRDPVPGQSPGDPDNRTLVTPLLLRQLEEATGRELPVVTELIDDRNRALAPIGPGADVIISGKLIGLLMAQISQNRHLAAVFEELFSADGTGVRLRPATDCVLPGRETSFATVVAAARHRGDCAIGYRSHEDSSTSPGYGVRINPPKYERRRWTVVAPDPRPGRPSRT